MASSEREMRMVRHNWSKIGLSYLFNEHGDRFRVYLGVRTCELFLCL